MPWKDPEKRRQYSRKYQQTLAYKNKRKFYFTNYYANLREEKKQEIREKDRLRKRLSREKNPEKDREIRERFKAKHPGYHAKKMAKYRKKDPERFRQQNKEYHTIRRKEIHQRLLQRWEENPELKKRAIESQKITSNKFRDKYNKNKLKKYHLVNNIINEKRKIRRILLKLEVMSHYSNGIPKCNRCQETMIEFLNIDHIIPRKEHGHSWTFGSDKLHKWLLKNNLPPGFQILCSNCNMIKAFELRERKLSQKPERIKEREWKKRFKIEVLSHYSKGKPKCNCCGFSKIEGLSIDHIKPIKESKRDRSIRSVRLYQLLKREKFPDGFQVLCINCNSAKSDKEFCPHQNLKILNLF